MKRKCIKVEDGGKCQLCRESRRLVECSYLNDKAQAFVCWIRFIVHRLIISQFISCHGYGQASSTEPLDELEVTNSPEGAVQNLNVDVLLHLAVEPIALDTKSITQDEEDAILLTRLSSTRFEDIKNEDLLMAWRVSLKRELPDANPDELDLLLHERYQMIWNWSMEEGCSRTEIFSNASSVSDVPRDIYGLSASSPSPIIKMEK